MDEGIRITNFKDSPYYLELYRERYESVFWKECSWEFRCHFWVKDKITNREIAHIIINEKDCMDLLSSIYNYIQFAQGEIVVPFVGNSTNPDIYMFHFYMGNALFSEFCTHPIDDLDTVEYFVIKKYNSLEQITVDLVKFEFVENLREDAINLAEFCAYIYNLFLYDIADNAMYDPGWLM